MTATTSRCDRIIQLIDDCLAEYEADLAAVPDEIREATTRRRPRGTSAPATRRTRSR